MKGSLAEALPKEQKRVREVLELYKAIPAGALGAAFIEQSLNKAEKAAASGDVVLMIAAYEELREIE